VTAKPVSTFAQRALVRTDVRTRQGVVPIWSRPNALAGGAPVVVAIQGPFAGPDDLANLPEELAPVADAAILRLPGIGAPRLSGNTLEAAAEAVGEVIAQRFAGRPVVLMGVSAGAVIALAVRTPAVRRIVAVEPLLRTADLGPLEGAPAAPLVDTLLGRAAPVDHLALLDRLDRPCDVVLGDARRPAGSPPSLVDETARARLAAHPRVRLHRAPGCGHQVPVKAGQPLRDVLLEVARRAAAEPAYDLRQLDEPLIEATPLTARRVLHWGPGGVAFAGAFLSWRPDAALQVLGEDPAADADPAAGAEPLEALALGAPPPPGLLPRLAAKLAAGGTLVARWSAAQAATPALRQALADSGLSLREPVDEAGTGVLRAQKLAAGQAPEPALRLQSMAFAPYLMDVRSRLPARGLRTDPELAVRYVTAPHALPPAPLGAPKVLVLQRPAPMSLERGRALMANAVARGWIVVIEYDDHPGLVAEALERPFGPRDMDRFGYAHAIQTTTEPLRALFAGCVPEVVVFENTVFELAQFPRQDQPRRVFYGAISRGSYGADVARSLAPAVARFPDLEFVVLGDQAVFEALPTANKTLHGFLPYEAYLARMAECAVSLSPIEPHPLRETKSDAKFLDAARAGVVTIASPLIYDRVIRHGENGLLASGLDDWAPLLIQALEDLPLRRAMARAAWDEVRQKRMFAYQVETRREWFRKLWADRAALDASACARIPGLAEAVAAERAALAAQGQR
jgi:glycosyltransferase involved in cell wall biosynthesis